MTPRWSGSCSPRDTTSACTATATATCCASPPRQVREDLARAEDSITAAAGRPLALYRPPYGVLNTAALRLARRRGWRTLLWRRWGRDWRADATPERIARRVSHAVAAGDVLLLHDADDYSAPGSWRRTAAALPLVLEQLARDGLAPAPV